MPILKRPLMVCVASLALCAFAALDPPPSQPSAGGPGLAAALASLRSAEDAVKASTRAEAGFALDGTTASPARLETQWAAVRRWTALWLDRHP